MHTFLMLLGSFIFLLSYGYIKALRSKSQPLPCRQTVGHLIPNTMFTFNVSVEIIDATGKSIATIPFTVDSGETLGTALTTAEGLIKPLLSIGEAVLKDVTI